jgi:Lipocalin-like domain
MNPSTIDLTGSWRLLAVRSYVGGQLENPHHNGVDPVGFIHYLSGGRVAVLVADGQRPVPDVANRTDLTDAQRAQADATFNAYGGTYTRDGARIVHHLDICSFQAHVGNDYVRQIEVDGEHLVLCTTAVPTPDGDRVVKLTWERLTTTRPD